MPDPNQSWRIIDQVYFPKLLKIETLIVLKMGNRIPDVPFSLTPILCQLNIPEFE